LIPLATSSSPTKKRRTSRSHSWTLLVRQEDWSVKLLVYRKKSHTDQYLNFGSRHPLNHKLAVIRTLLERCYSIVTDEDDRKKEEEDVAKVLGKCGYPPWTIDRVKQDIVENSLKDEAKKVKNTRGNHQGMVVVPYVKGMSEAFARILKFHGIATANCPHRTLRNFVVHPKDKIRDEEKTELIYHVPCKNCSSSYVGVTGRKFGVRIKEHKKKVDSFTAGTQIQAYRARESSVTHKSAITDHAVEENHVIDWDKAKVVDREAQQQTRWIKEALWIRKTSTCMNPDAGSYQLSHTWDQVISRLVVGGYSVIGSKVTITSK